MDDRQFWNEFSSKTPDYREGYMDGYRIGLNEGLKHHANNNAAFPKMKHKKNWLDIYAEESY